MPSVRSRTSNSSRLSGLEALRAEGSRSEPPRFELLLCSAIANGLRRCAHVGCALVDGTLHVRIIEAFAAAPILALIGANFRVHAPLFKARFLPNGHVAGA